MRALILLDAVSLLSVDTVTKQYATVRAVDGLSFDVETGEIFALLGPNGAGKTTLVRMLVGIQRPDSGRIVFRVSGRESARLPAKQSGYLPEERGLYRDVSVLRTLEYFGVLRGMGRARARAAAQEGLQKLGLGGREHERVDALSKGNQQKVQFLSAVLHGPRFAVLDEPFSGLDPVNQQRFLDEIRLLRDRGCTILLSAHQMDLVESLADRLLLIDNGRAVLHGTLEEIRRQTQSGARLQLGVHADAESDGLSGLPGIVRVERPTGDRIELWLEPDAGVGDVLHAVTARCRVLSVHSGSESLREIFVRTVGHPVDSQEAES
jgi:ABC-2 type transport system ATP-binding protein